jgi:hypothetical protein
MRIFTTFLLSLGLAIGLPAQDMGGGHRSSTLKPTNFAYVVGSVTACGINTSRTTCVATLNHNPGAGHFLKIGVFWGGATATATVTSPNNGTWKPIGSPKTGIGTQSGFRGQMFCVGSATAGAETVTVTISAANTIMGWESVEYSYSGKISDCSAADGTPVYSTTAASGGVATISGLTTTGSSDLLLVDCLAVDSKCTAGAGFTGRNDTNYCVYNGSCTFSSRNFNTDSGFLIEEKTGVAAGAQTGTFGTGATDNVILGMVAE